MTRQLLPPTPEQQFLSDTPLLPRVVMRTELETQRKWYKLAPEDQQWLCRHFSQQLRYQDANLELQHRLFREDDDFILTYAYGLARTIIAAFLLDPATYKAKATDLEPGTP